MRSSRRSTVPASRARMIAPTAFLAVAALGLAACSSGEDGSGGGSTSSEVEIWLYPTFADEAEHRAFWDAKIEEFEAQNEGITVSYEIFPWANRDEAIQTALAGGVGPDLIYLVPDQLSTYEDSIEPLDAYLPEAHVDALQDNVAGAITTDKGLLGAPVLTSSDPLVCNAAVFEEVGADLPSTWEDLREAAPKFAAAGKHLLAYWGSPEVSLNASFYPFLWQAGGQVFTEDGSDVAFNDEAGLEALEFILELHELGALDPDTLTTFPALEQTGLATGDTACQYGSYQPGLFVDLWEEEDIAVLPALENVERVGYGTIGSLAMFDSSDSKEAAGKFVAFASSQEVVEEYVVATNYFSPFEGSAGLYEEGTLQAQNEATTEFTTVGQLHPSAREVMGVLSAEIQAALLDGKDPQQALDDAAAAARSIL